MPGSLGRYSGDQLPHLLARNDSAEIMHTEKIKHDDWHLIVHAEGKRGGIHYLELFAQRF